MSDPHTYSRLDKVLHHVAFAGIGIQKALADIEDRIFVDRFEHLPVQKPVFITSLPRAGTTLLLEVLSVLPDFATHTYRDMPFLLCPMFWEQIAGPFRENACLHERAHGDGMAIGFDSAEAFEEILWKAFWPDKYLTDRIRTWTTTDRHNEFEHFFRNHIRKIIALRSSSKSSSIPQRYLSKNNANISRLELLADIFPDCRIIIPIRNPWDHIGSLRRQHKRFLGIHAEDPFGLQYMEWLGHCEFGRALRPIDIGGWMNEGALLDPQDETFWLVYWVEVYEAILAASHSNVCFFDYDRACTEPESMLEALAHTLELDDPATLLAQASRFRPQTRYAKPSETIDLALVSRVEQLYEILTARSVQPLSVATASIPSF